MFGKLVLVLAAVVIVKGDIYASCGDNLNCAQTNLIKLVDELDSVASVDVVKDSIVIERSDDEPTTARENEDVFDRLIRYLSNHQIKLKMPTSEMKSMEERRIKLRRFILPLLLVLKLKAAIIIPAVLSLIAFVAFNGFGASFMALMIAGATAMKSMLDNNHAPRVSYEVVPPISAAHLWSRAGIDAFPLGNGYHTIA